MPKGVEHSVASEGAVPLFWRLPLALMPKGVEHTPSPPATWRLRRLPLALMPKGVEHLMDVYDALGEGPAPRVDAERR